MLEKFKDLEVRNPERIKGGNGNSEGTQGQIIKSNFNRQTFRLK